MVFENKQAHKDVQANDLGVNGSGASSLRAEFLAVIAKPRDIDTVKPPKGAPTETKEPPAGKKGKGKGKGPTPI